MQRRERWWYYVVEAVGLFLGGVVSVGLVVWWRLVALPNLGITSYWIKLTIIGAALVATAVLASVFQEGRFSYARSGAILCLGVAIMPPVIYVATFVALLAAFVGFLRWGVLVLKKKDLGTDIIPT